MTLTESLTLLPALGAGALIAWLFFGGLWLTVNGLGHARRPVLTLLASLLARLVPACGAFYLVAVLGTWMHLLAATAGFLLLRVLMLRRLAPVSIEASPLRAHREEADG